MTAESAALRLLADENIELLVVELLKARGHDVVWIVNAAPGMDDADILSLAEREGRVLITYDVDFISALRLSGRSHIGAVLVRAGHFDIKWIANAIHETLSARQTWTGRIAVIKPSGIRYTPDT